MSDSTLPAAPARPATVAAATYLLLLFAAVSIAGAVIAIALDDRIHAAANTALSGHVLTDPPAEPVLPTSPEALSDGGRLTAIGSGVLFGVLFIGVALGVWRGARYMRGTTWLLGGLAAVYGTVMTISGNTGLAAGTAGADTPAGREALRHFYALLPAWYQPANGAIYAISALSAVGAVALLALPASSSYFRRRSMTHRQLADDPIERRPANVSARAREATQPVWMQAH